MTTTIDTDQLTDTIQGLKDAAASALQHESVEDFEAFERYVSEVDTFIREVQQSLWANDAKATIRRLEKGEPITDTDREVVRTFLISDAQRYLAHENNYQDWIKELNRIVAELGRRVNTVDRNSIADMRGIIKDAVRLVPDIRNYLEEKCRVEKFERALDTPDKASRELLVRVLREQLRSGSR